MPSERALRCLQFVAAFLMTLLGANAVVAEPANSSRITRLSEAATAFNRYPGEVVQVRTGDGLTIKGLYWARRNASRPLIVFYPGWGPDLPTILRQLEPVVKTGYGVLAALNRGDFGNPGKLSQAGAYADGVSYAALAKAKAEGGPVVLFGYSIGAPIAIEVASREDVSGVIVWGLFTSVHEINLPLVKSFISEPFDSRKAIGRVDEPLIMLYGQDDGVSPATHGKQLFALGKGPRALLELSGGSHFLSGGRVLPIINAATSSILSGDLESLRALATPGNTVTISSTKVTGESKSSTE